MGWKTIYPMQSEGWFHITSLLDAGEVYQYAITNWTQKVIKAWSICRSNFHPWKLDSEHSVKTFYEYLKNNVNTDDLKVRVQEKEP